MRDIMEQSRCAASALEPYAEQSAADTRLFIFISTQLLLSGAVCASHPAGHAGPAPSPGTFDWPVCFFAINPAGRLIINVKIHCGISGGSVQPHLSDRPERDSEQNPTLVCLPDTNPASGEKNPNNPETKQNASSQHPDRIQGRLRKCQNILDGDHFYLFSFVFRKSKKILNLWHQFTLFNWTIFTLWNPLNMDDKCVFFWVGGINDLLTLTTHSVLLDIYIMSSLK